MVGHCTICFFAANFGLFFAIINLQIVKCINGLTFAKCKLMLRSDAVPQVLTYVQCLVIAFSVQTTYFMFLGIYTHFKKAFGIRAIRIRKNPDSGF